MIATTSTPTPTSAHGRTGADNRTKPHIAPASTSTDKPMTETDETPTETPPGEPRTKTVTVRGTKGVSKATTMARTALSPEYSALLALSAVNDKSSAHRDLDLEALLGELMTATRDESATGTGRLLAQAAVLDRLFSHLTAVAMRQDYVSQIAPPLTLALRAQAQCRATLQAVSDIRHPRQYVGTQNVGEQYNAGGHMQVNRGDAEDKVAGDGAPGRDDGDDDARGTTSENRPNELTGDRTP